MYNNEIPLFNEYAIITIRPLNKIIKEKLLVNSNFELKTVVCKSQKSWVKKKLNSPQDIGSGWLMFQIIEACLKLRKKLK